MRGGNWIWGLKSSLKCKWDKRNKIIIVTWTGEQGGDNFNWKVKFRNFFSSTCYGTTPIWENWYQNIMLKRRKLRTISGLHNRVSRFHIKNHYSRLSHCCFPVSFIFQRKVRFSDAKEIMVASCFPQTSLFSLHFQIR